ncbi:MAG TPA: NAD(P)-binding protein [Streptosporangiaceae bacterium]|nr:NAD(P)-binding protein [Streptosporangiaceae bacterium]
MTDRFDVIIIGTGAGGGTLAHTLAPTGKKILLLERGDFLTREMANWDPGAVFVDGAGGINLAYTFTNEAETAGLYEEFMTILNKTGLAAHHVLSKNFYMDMEVPIAGVAHQAGTMRFGKERLFLFPTSTAKHMSSTISTSPTRASFRASARSTLR